MSVSIPDPRAVEAHLSAAPQPFALSVQEQNQLKDASVRRHIAYLIVGIFGLAILLTYVLVGWVYWNDQQELARNLVRPSERIIGTSVIASLIAATIAELAGLAVLIVRFVFPAAADADAPPAFDEIP